MSVTSEEYKDRKSRKKEIRIENVSKMERE